MDKQLDMRRPVPQKHYGLSTVSKIFFGVDIFQVVMVVVFQSVLIACGNFNAYNNPENPGMGPGRRIYMCVYMGVIVYTCFLCLFAVKEKNFLEILAFLLQNFGFVAYGLIQVYHVGYKQHPRGKGSNATVKHSPLLRNIALTNSLVLFLLNGVFIFLSWKLYIEFGWKIYKRVRFNLSLRSVYHYYQFLICLLKMAIMYWWMYAICNSFVLLRDHESVMYYIILGFIPVSVVYAWLGYFATQREIKGLMVIFILWTLGVIGYFVYKLYGFTTNTCNGCPEFHETGKDIPDEALYHFVYLGTLNLLILLAILGVACKVFSNFGKGLAQHFKPRSDKRLRSGTDLNLRRLSHYVEESVVSATSNESEHDELQDSTRLGLGYLQLTLTTGAPLLNSNARILASSMPNLFEASQKARTLPIGKETSHWKDRLKPSAVNNSIASAVKCTLAVIDEDDDIMREFGKISTTEEMNGHGNNEPKESIENGIKKAYTNGMNGKSAPNPAKETARTCNKKAEKPKDLDSGRTADYDENDDDDVFTDRVDKRNSRDSGFMESPRVNDKIKDHLRTRKIPIICKDGNLTKGTSISNSSGNGRNRQPNAEEPDIPPHRTNEGRKRRSLTSV